MIMQQTRVVTYIRVSSIEQVDGYSIGEQIERLKKYCEAMGWTIADTFIDPGYSGGSVDRPGLQAMIKRIEKGDIDRVVVYKLDRLSRSQKDTLMLIEDVFLKNKTDFVSMNENFDTSSPFGRAMIGILAVFAQLEREQIKERTMMGKEARAKEGKWGGGSTQPVGYNYNPVTEELEINEYESMQVLEAVELFLKGTPLRTICRIFEAKGYTYRGQGKVSGIWEPKRLKYVLRNRLYIGEMKYHNEWHPGNHKPILSVETFNKLQKLLDDREEMYAEHKKKIAGYVSYLGGFLHCKHCGGKYTYTAWSRKNGPATKMYVCYSRCKKVPKMIKDPNCKNKNWKMEELDNLIFAEIRKLATDPEYINTIKTEKEEQTGDVNKIEVIKKEIAKIDEQISRFMDLYGIGQFDIEQVKSKVEPLNKHKQALEAELQSINAVPVALSEKEAVRIAKDFEDVLNRGDLNEVRLLIESLIYYIELDGEDAYIHWKFA